HSVPRDFPPGVLDGATLGRTFYEDGVGVVDVRVDAAARRQDRGLLEAAARIADGQVRHVFGTALGEAGPRQLVGAPERSVEEQGGDPVDVGGDFAELGRGRNVGDRGARRVPKPEADVLFG